MSNLPVTPETKAGDEEVCLTLIPGTGDTQNNNNNCSTDRRTQDAASCLRDEHHRKLAICSIICGISCIGIKALISSVKAEKTIDPEKAAEFSHQAKKYGIISIVTWVTILVLTPLLLALISYLLTLKD